MSRGNQGHISGSAALSEARFHRACAGFLALRLRPPDFFSTFPAGGGGKMRGAALKAAGLKPGMPDIFPLIINGNVYGIELKAEKGHLTDVQHEMHTLLKLSGGVKEIAVCRPTLDGTIDDFVAILVMWSARLSPVTPSAERLQMAIAAWNRNEQKNSRNSNFLVDEFPESDKIGSRR